MKEVKTPKRPLIYYYCIALLLILLFNFLAVPYMSQQEIKEVDYGTFMRMADKKQISAVEVQDNQILFANKDNTIIYKTGKMDDPDLLTRLSDSGAEFSRQIVDDSVSPWVYLLTWLLPIILFFAVGQYMSKKLLEKAGGGGNAMMFGLGKSNAKIYVHSTEGIKFEDVAGEDEAKESLMEIVEYLHDPSKYNDIGASMPKGIPVSYTHLDVYKRQFLQIGNYLPLWLEIFQPSGCFQLFKRNNICLLYTSIRLCLYHLPHKPASR